VNNSVKQNPCLRLEYISVRFLGLSFNRQIKSRDTGELLVGKAGGQASKSWRFPSSEALVSCLSPSLFGQKWLFSINPTPQPELRPKLAQKKLQAPQKRYN